MKTEYKRLETCFAFQQTVSERAALSSESVYRPPQEVKLNIT